MLLTCFLSDAFLVTPAKSLYFDFKRLLDVTRTSIEKHRSSERIRQFIKTKPFLEKALGSGFAIHHETN